MPQELTCLRQGRAQHLSQGCARFYAAGMSNRDNLADYPDLEPEDPWDIKAVVLRDIAMRDASDPVIFARMSRT
jgi:hypothetical protein